MSFSGHPEAPKNCSVVNQTIELPLVYDLNQIYGLGPKPILKRKLALNLGSISKLTKASKGLVQLGPSLYSGWGFLHSQ